LNSCHSERSEEYPRCFATLRSTQHDKQAFIVSDRPDMI